MTLEFWNSLSSADKIAAMAVSISVASLLISCVSVWYARRQALAAKQQVEVAKQQLVAAHDQAGAAKRQAEAAENQLEVSRLNNLANWRPALVIHRQIDHHSVGDLLTFTLVNNGLGPAIIDQIVFRVGPITIEADDVSVMEHVARMVVGDVQYQLLRRGLPGRGGHLSAGTSIVLAEIATPKAEVITERINEKQLNARISYRSIHGEQFELKTELA